MFKEELKFKHYFIIILFGLNSDFIFTAFAIPALALLIFLISKKKNWLNVIKILSIFIFTLIIANLNLFIIASQNIELHRAEFVRSSYGLIDSIKFFFNFIFKLPTSFDHSLIKKIPYFKLHFHLFFYFLSKKDTNTNKNFLILFFSFCFDFLKVNYSRIS